MSGDSAQETVCPGCGLTMPANPHLAYDGYYHCSAECWDVFAEVLGRDYTTPFIYGSVHQLTVDTYAVQHAGGPHPDKSVTVHLMGLYLAFERDMPAYEIAPLLHKLANEAESWPRLAPPTADQTLTVFDVALASDPVDHVATVRQWAAATWRTWADHHVTIAALAQRYLPLQSSPPSAAI